MFQKFVAVTVLSLLFSNPTSANYVYQSVDESNLDIWTLNCHIDKVDSAFPQKMDDIGITVIAKFNPDKRELAYLNIIHHLSDGIDVDRGKQYSNAHFFAPRPDHMRWEWIGTIEKYTLAMKGILIFEDLKNNKISYMEENYQYGKIRYTMYSSCKVIDIKEPDIVRSGPGKSSKDPMPEDSTETKTIQNRRNENDTTNGKRLRVSC